MKIIIKFYSILVMKKKKLRKNIIDIDNSEKLKSPLANLAKLGKLIK